ncbi:MAG: ABC transporter substrate-binding protein [Spirochaetaceae bacterium]|jgi:iron(III) transport system substrate-binding protein|nr:ABC transporter substrate-binding protein [Spirochaetaceae bacterium]
MKLTKSLIARSSVGLIVLALISLMGACSKKADTAQVESSVQGVSGKLIVYTSMKESLISNLKTEFVKQNPGVDMDYQSAGAGSLMAKIAAERESGRIMADIIWTSEVPDFFKMKGDGLLIQYKPKGLDQILNPLEGADDYFVPARLGTLGIVYNTRQVTKPPTAWNDLLGSEFKGAFSIADPALSGTSFVSVALLKEKFGDDFFKALRANGATIGKGSGQVVDDTASGELAACLGVDYIAFDKIDKGATLAIAYPPEILLIPSPVAILKDTKSLDAAQQFVDFMLTKEAQQIIADNGTLPTRRDVTVPAKYNLPSVESAVANGIKIDYISMMAEREARISSFKAIMQK